MFPSEVLLAYLAACVIVVISPGPTEPDARYKGSRESRPMVDGATI